MIVKNGRAINLGGLNRRINLIRPRRTLASIGIPVSTTNEIVLSGLTGGYFSKLNGTYSKSSNPSGVGGGGVNGNGAVVYFNNAYNSGYGSAIWFDSNSSKWYLTYVDDSNDFYAGEVSGTISSVPFGGFTPVQGYLAYEGTITLTAVSETNNTAFSGATTPLNSVSTESNILLLKGFKFDYGDYTNRYIRFVGGLANEPLVAWDGDDKYFYIVPDSDPNTGGYTWRLFVNSVNFGSIQIATYTPSNPYSYWGGTMPTTGWVTSYGITGSIIFRKDTTYPIDPVYTGTLLPSDVQGLKVWLKASNGVTTENWLRYASDGETIITETRVKTWADQSGSGLSVSDAGFDPNNGAVRRPLLVPNGLNGYAVIRYDNGSEPDDYTNYGTGTHSALSGIPDLSQTEYTIHIVQKFNALYGSLNYGHRHIISIGQYNPASFYASYSFAQLSHIYIPYSPYVPTSIQMAFDSGQQRISPRWFNGKYEGSGFAIDNPIYTYGRNPQFATVANYASMFRVLSLTYSATRGVVEVRVDGAIQILKNVPRTSLPNATNGRMIISKFSPYSNELDRTRNSGTFQDVAEVVIFNRALSQEENAKIVNGLKVKYNL